MVDSKIERMKNKLLTREEFKAAVFKRDNSLCVICKSKGKEVPAEDAHHIIERRLFTEENERFGYFLNNGVSVCDEKSPTNCHLNLCETTLISCEELRELAGITEIVLPTHLYKDHQYDKWGNPILSNGTRLKGELFHEESVQKVLNQVLHLFTNKIKYPRTFHLPWSPGITSDDRIMTDLSILKEAPKVVVTTKMDGENSTLYCDYYHARSLESNPHPSRNWLKNFHSQIGHEIPEGYRFCGENLFAKHSISYDNLKSFFLLFSVWDDKNNCLSWEETLEWAALLELQVVPTLYQGKFDEKLIRSLYPEPRSETQEGYVIRVANSFHYKDFKRNVGKFVRANHISSETFNWRNQPIIQNKLVKDFPQI